MDEAMLGIKKQGLGRRAAKAHCQVGEKDLSTIAEIGKTNDQPAKRTDRIKKEVSEQHWELIWPEEGRKTLQGGKRKDAAGHMLFLI